MLQSAAGGPQLVLVRVIRVEVVVETKALLSFLP